MGDVAASLDPLWPAASQLLTRHRRADRRNVALLGVSTYATSVTPRSATSTPAAIRAALARFSTWSYEDDTDLAQSVALVDLGDVEDPDGPGALERVAAALEGASNDDLALVLGGDNAATYLALAALAAGRWDSVGLVTLDAHHDLREGVSNGSPVRQALDAGLDGAHVVQVGLADFSNSPAYAARARKAGIHVVSRAALRRESLDAVIEHAIDVASEGGRRVYVDLDVDVCDRAVVPGCPAAAPGGLSADELRRVARCAGADERVAVIDITEIDVARDSADERTVRLAALVVLEALAGVTRRRS
jgi:formiminoglutamase